ncbi:universal stress protein [Niveispirillum sp.]|uniref:universal stress protein n=1 Tax=Niveispirillum sp. TaxID=1917217 RepID=UPI001B40EF29|nr:universal stress protein [Niveispirillum sp.]MBP7340318.1 universal stress protein [Niveispirillum sp.]
MFMSMNGGLWSRREEPVATTPPAPPDRLHHSVAGEEAGERFKFLVCVDGSPQSRAALRFAALRARNTGGLLALLHVCEPVDCQGWMRVADTMEAEQREEAECLLQDMAGEVWALTGLMPELNFRRGAIGAEILEAIREDGDIHALVVGAAPALARRGRLISWLAGELAGSLDIPLVIVPGNLTDRQIDRLA